MAESQGPTTVLAISIVFGVSTFIALSLRLFARIFLVKRFGIDDILICVAACLSWAFVVVTILAVDHGLGSHYSDVAQRGAANLLTYGQLVWLSSIFYNACLGFIKTSVLELYTRLGDRTLRRMALVMIGVVSCQASGNALACVFQCAPLAKAWNTALPGKCIDINAFYLANAAVNISTDVLTYALPIRLVMNLQMPQRQKVGLGVMLCLGFIACLSSIIRISYIPQMLTSLDATWAIKEAMYWSVIEINVGILAASIPSYKVIAATYAPRLLGSLYDRSTHGNTNGKAGLHGSSIPLGSVDREASRHRGGAAGGAGAGSGPPPPSAGVKVDQYGLNTQIERELHHDDSSSSGRGSAESKTGTASSSEEALYASPGRIGVKTQIVTRYDNV